MGAKTKELEDFKATTAAEMEAKLAKHGEEVRKKTTDGIAVRADIFLTKTYNEIQALKKERDEAQTNAKSLKRKHDEMEKRVDELEEETDDLYKEVDTLKLSKFDQRELEKKYEELLRENRRLSADYETERGDRLSVLDELEQAKGKIFALECRCGIHVL